MQYDAACKYGLHFSKWRCENKLRAVPEPPEEYGARILWKEAEKDKGSESWNKMWVLFSNRTGITWQIKCFLTAWLLRYVQLISRKTPSIFRELRHHLCCQVAGSPLVLLVFLLYAFNSTSFCFYFFSWGTFWFSIMSRMSKHAEAHKFI